MPIYATSFRSRPLTSQTTSFSLSPAVGSLVIAARRRMHHSKQFVSRTSLGFDRFGIAAAARIHDEALGMLFATTQ